MTGSANLSIQVMDGMIEVCRIEHSKDICTEKQSEYHYHDIEDGLDLTIHWNESVDEIESYPNDNENHEQSNNRHSRPVFWGTEKHSVRIDIAKTKHQSLTGMR